MITAACSIACILAATFTCIAVGVSGIADERGRKDERDRLIWIGAGAMSVTLILAFAAGKYS